MQGFYRISADVVLFVHFLVVAFNVGALPLTWVSHLRGWPLACNPYFRITHLALVAYVTVETAFGVVCPLTNLEDALRIKAGGNTVYEGGFVSHWLHQAIFWDVSTELLFTLYALFLGLVLLTFFFIRPRQLKWKAEKPRSGLPLH